MFLFNSRATTTELVAQCLAGDQGAWNALIDRFSRLVYSVPREYRLCEANADDVFQAVFQRLYQGLSTIRDPNRLPAWLVRTAQRECWRIGRRHRCSTAKSIEGVDAHSESPAELAMRLEERQRVREAMAQLPKRDRALLTALFFEQDRADYASIAHRLDMRLGSIGPNRARAFKKLEQILIANGFDASNRFANHVKQNRQARRQRLAAVRPLIRAGAADRL